MGKKNGYKIPPICDIEPVKVYVVFSVRADRAQIFLRAQWSISIDLYSGPPLMGSWVEELGVFLKKNGNRSLSTQQKIEPDRPALKKNR